MSAKSLGHGGDRPERQLLLAAARLQAGAQIPEGWLLEPQFEQVDWPLYLRSTLKHGIMPGFSAGAAERTRQKLPDEVRSALSALPFEIAARNTRRAEELVQVARALDRNAVTPLFFKGLLLGDLLYGGIAGRKAGDIDMLVPPEQATKAEEVLHELGYRHVAHHREIRAALTDPQAYHVGYVRGLGTADESLVELHWRLLPLRPSFPIREDMLPTDDVFSRADRRALHGVSVRTLSGRDLLLYLAAHAAKHSWFSAGFLSDLARCVRHVGVEATGELLREEAERRELPVLRFGLHVVDALAPGALPEALRPSLPDDAWLRRLQPAITAERMFRLGDEEDPDLLPVRIAVASLALPGKLERVAAVTRIAFSPTYADTGSVPLPRPLHPLYAALRPFRLALLLWWKRRRRAAKPRVSGRYREAAARRPPGPG